MSINLYEACLLISLSLTWSGILYKNRGGGDWGGKEDVGKSQMQGHS